jgi:hypothetical protein
MAVARRHQRRNQLLIMSPSLQCVCLGSLYMQPSSSMMTQQTRRWKQQQQQHQQLPQQRHHQR